MSNPMNVVVVGAGYVGLATTAMLVQIGHKVTVLDTLAERIELLQSGRSPISEPQLDSILAQAQHRGLLQFTTDPTTAYSKAEVAYICVGTPAGVNGEADLSHLYGSIETVSTHAPEVVVVVKSTVPPGTQRELQERFPHLLLVSNPEFLQQGSAVKAATTPDRVVLGTTDPDARMIMQELFAPLAERGIPIVDVDPESAELIKYASNSFLATKIAFINEIADLCEAIGADIDEVAYGMGLDSRIGNQFLKTGPGYGGSCFPKDTEAFVAAANNHGVHLSIIDAVAKSNIRRRASLAQRVFDLSGETPRNLRVGVLGATFKAGTDDLRDSPAVDLILGLANAGADVVVFEPLGNLETIPELSGIEVAQSASDAVKGADVLVIATEWPEFATLDFSDIAMKMNGALVVDLRNILDQKVLMSAGLSLHQIGKPSPIP